MIDRHHFDTFFWSHRHRYRNRHGHTHTHDGTTTKWLNHGRRMRMVKGEKERRSTGAKKKFQAADKHMAQNNNEIILSCQKLFWNCEQDIRREKKRIFFLVLFWYWLTLTATGSCDMELFPLLIFIVFTTRIERASFVVPYVYLYCDATLLSQKLWMWNGIGAFFQGYRRAKGWNHSFVSKQESCQISEFKFRFLNWNDKNVV